MKFLPRNIIKVSFALLTVFLFSNLITARAQLPNVYEQTTTVEAGVPIDMDGDGIPNWWELLYGLNPIDPSDAALDNDGDTLTNLVEFQHLTNPLKADTDDGGVWDNLEIEQCNNPLDPADDHNGNNCINRDVIKAPKDPRGDRDGDGLSNTLEDELGTNKHSVDTDDDGVNDYDEVYKYLTNPLETDTDFDGVNDYDEIYTYLTDPNNRDSDFDGLIDSEEIFTYKTNPTYWDTDEGGMSDKDEITNSSNPLNKGDDFQFIWSIYYGNKHNDLYKTLSKNKIDIYQGMNLTIEAVKPVEAAMVRVKFNEKSFDTEKEYIKLKLLSPENPGIFTIEFILSLESGQVIRMTRFVEVRQRGTVVSRIDGTFNDLYDNIDYFDDQPVDGAKIEVYEYNEYFGEMQLFQSDIFDIANPQYTDANGTYLLALHPGNYLIKISKPEFGTKEILYSTDGYSIYSKDVYLNYDYDVVVWGGVFFTTFISVWFIINLANYIRHLISLALDNRTKHRRAY